MHEEILASIQAIFDRISTLAQKDTEFRQHLRTVGRAITGLAEEFDREDRARQAAVRPDPKVVAAVAALIAFPVYWYRRRRGVTGPDLLECRLIAELREIAREPVPDRDHPNFKHWNPRDRFPWGWELIQGQLHERVARKYGRG